MAAPFIMSSSVSLAYVSGGSFGGVAVPFDTSKFVNGYKLPVEIREIRIMLASRTTNAVLLATPVVCLDMKLGRYQMTDGAVPVSILSPYRVSDDPQTDTSRFEINDAGQVESISFRRLVLPKPIILVPGAGFSAISSIPMNELLNTARFDTAFTAVVNLTFVGRFMPCAAKNQSTNSIPIISHTQLSQTKRVSAETELRNPLGVPIRVHRVIGARVISDPFTQTLAPSFASLDASIDLRFPDNTASAETPADFPRIFGQSRAWPVSFDMPAAARIRAQIGSNATEALDATFAAYQIALFGTREEAI